MKRTLHKSIKFNARDLVTRRPKIRRLPPILLSTSVIQSFLFSFSTCVKKIEELTQSDKNSHID
jgi:hypothetical protein